MLRSAVILLLITCSLNVLAQDNGDTVHLLFDMNHAELNTRNTKTIDSLVYNDWILSGNAIKIIGYADYTGSEQYNKTLSEKRAKNIAAYLVSNNISDKNITLCIGNGEIERKGMYDREGYQPDRKVDLVVYGHKAAKKAPSGHPAIDIHKYKPGQTFALRNLYFFPGRHTLRPESEPVLGQLYEAMANNPQLKIRIEGHVCCIADYMDGHDLDNGQDNLSVNRAKTVYDYLLSKGISHERMQFIGYGRSRPVVPEEKTEEDANKNRRVEIRVLKN